MIETTIITVLDCWTGAEEEFKDESFRTKQQLLKQLKKGFRIKFVTSGVLGNAMMIHYVLEKELDK